MSSGSANTIRLANGLRGALKARGHEITLYAISEAQVSDGLATGMLSFYLPPAPTTHADLVDEFVAYLLEHAPALVKSRVSYGQSVGDGKPDYFYVINPEESTQGALSAEVKNAQKHDNVQICRISVPERAEISVKAGCDIALNCWAKMDDMIGIAERLPSMSDETAARLERALAGTGIAPEGDKAELLAMRDTLLAIAGAAA